MERAEKAETIEALRTRLSKVQSLILADFRGVTVASDTVLRNEFRQNGCEYRVVKNSLLGIAIKGTSMETIGELLVGPTAIAYSYEDPSAPAKVATRVAKQEEKFIVKGGYVDGRVLDARGVEILSKLPGRSELRGTFLATLLAVPQSFLRLTIAAQQNMLLLLAARGRSISQSE